MNGVRDGGGGLLSDSQEERQRSRSCRGETARVERMYPRTLLSLPMVGSAEEAGVSKRVRRHSTSNEDRTAAALPCSLDLSRDRDGFHIREDIRDRIPATSAFFKILSRDIAFANSAMRDIAQRHTRRQISRLF